MRWSEFKNYVEAAGVRDDSPIDKIILTHPLLGDGELETPNIRVKIEEKNGWVSIEDYLEEIEKK